MTKKDSKRIDLELIPEIQEKITAVISREIDALGEKKELNDEESKRLIAYSSALSTMFKEYRAQVVQIEKELRGRTKEEILEIVKADSKGDRNV